jgi:ribonuclease G
MQAAFVDIGLSLNAFLYVKDIAPAHYDENGEIIRKDDSLPPIADYLTAGQELTVQIIKEQTGRKGARVTTRLTIPGRFAVLLPETLW